MLNICIVAGARPNFIKVAPLIRTIIRMSSEGYAISYRLVYAGSENDSTLEKSLFEDLQIPQPDVFLGVEHESLVELTGKMMSEFDRYLTTSPADIVIVVDDLASTMAAAIVAKKRGIKLAHLVAGTRSFDINMPKEINRLVIDSLSDMLFTAGASSNYIATRSGADMSNVYMVGNILMDTMRYNYPHFKRPAVLHVNNIKDNDYIVLTINRKALLNDKDNLHEIISNISKAAQSTTIIAPLRDYASKAIGDITSTYKNIITTAPLSYLEFGYLTSRAKGIITDSGNVAEEATFNSIPCITINNYTEHIETVKQGSNILVGEDPDKLSEYVSTMVDGRWKTCSLPDRWDGRTSERIIQILIKNIAN